MVKRKLLGILLVISPDGKYFYGAASQDGKLFQINLNKLEISSKLDLGSGSNPLQGTFIW